jgi:hypothetical protein
MTKSGGFRDADFFCTRVLNDVQRKKALPFLLSAVGALLCIALFPPAVEVHAGAAQPPVEQATAPAVASGDAFKAGDIAATSFAGTKLVTESLPPGVDPITKTFLDPDGIVLRIYSSEKIAGPSAGQTLSPPAAFEAKAQEIGHVFGLAFDNLPAKDSATPGLFAAATSAFGLQLVGPDGSNGLKRLSYGAAGASFMAGQFGSLPSAGPGTIYKIERSTGDVRVFANVETDGAGNSGPGLGALAFDAASRTLYVSDLETGLIHAFSSDGSDIGQFDHGVTARPLGKKPAVPDDGKRADIKSPFFDASKPATWGFTQKERRIDALAVHDGRLFYSVAEGPEVWSIGVDASGKFGSDPRLETSVSAEQPFPVTSIAFDQSGRMITTQRGTLENPTDYSHFTAKGAAQTLRYAPEAPDEPNRPNRWKPDPEEYAVGNAEGFRSSDGGLTLQYAYKADGSLDLGSCGGTIIVSGNSLGANLGGHGLQINAVDLVRPANAPPAQSTFIDFDARQDDTATRGYAGGIAVLQDCGGDGFPAVAGGGGSGFPPVSDGGAGGGTMPPVAGDGGGGTTMPPVAGDGGGGTTFPPVDETQGGGGTTAEGGGGTTTKGPLTMTKTAVSATCSENQPCTYKITVTNTSATAIQDKIVIDDALSIGGVPFQKAKLEVSAGWECVASAAPTVQCSHPGPLEPNTPLELTVTFTPEAGSLAGAAEIKNCASFPNAAPAGNNGPQQQLPPPPPPTNTLNGGLKVETLGTTPSCSPATGNCEFEIKITNTTGQPITGPLKIFDTLAVGTQSQAKNTAKSMQLPPGLQCKPEGREFNCSQDPLTLAPNQSLSLKVAFEVDTVEGGKANFVQNKTNVTFGPLTGEATAAIAFDADNKIPEPGADGQQAGAGGAATPACASIPVAPKGPIVVNKKGPAKCPLKGPCAFTIDVTNSSDAPIAGPIEIQDTIDVANATIAGAVAEPFSCDAGGPPFKCRFNGTLQPKETKTLALTLNIDAPAGTKSLKNCAVPTQPQAAVPGGGQGDGGQQKQFAPGKKSELLPFGKKSLFALASFRPQSIAPSKPLIHLTGGAGGNIGGIGPNKCLKFKFPNAFSVRQSNDVAITLTNASANAAGQFLGSASIFMSKSGSLQGNMGDGRHPKFEIIWQDGTVSVFTGSIDDNGTLSGITQNRTTGQNLRFTGLQPWKCEVDQLCQDYANEAVAAATEFGALKCGATGPGRFSTNQKEHLDWCMAQTRGGGSPIKPEADARKTQLDSCRTLDAECTTVGKAVAAKNDEMKALKCKDAIPSLQPDAAKALCRAKPIDKDAFVPAVQQKLDACKAELAANGGAGGNPGGAGNPGGDPAGGAGDPGNAGGGNAQVPAGNQCVVVELEDNKPGDQKEAGPEAKQLTLAKNPVAAKCSSVGGGCAFMISISNPAGAPEFNGPITVNDRISAPDGSPFPNITMVTPVNAIQPEGVVGNIGCLKNGNDVTCTSAAMKIPPGKTIQIPMTFTPGNGSVATAIKNCASFVGGEQQCATIPLTADALLRANKIGGGTTCVPLCAYGISLTNVGNSPATGPFVLSEDFTPMGPNAKIEVIDGDFACNQVGTKVGCISTNKNTNVLSPGETINGRVKISGVDLSPEYKNCLGYDPNAQAKPSPFDNEWPGRCVTVKEANPFRAKLDIFKAVKDLGCKVDGPCRYEIIISNFGAEYSGPIEVIDEVPAVSTAGKQQPQPAGVEPMANADWTCTKLDPRRMSCSANKKSLGSGGANITLPVIVTPGPGWKKNDVVENCATLKAAPGTIGDGKRACAQYTLDPFNVKVTKTGDQTCAPGGECRFTINLFNPGPIDHNAPVTISDNLKGLSSAQILSISPPLPCATQPTQIPFSCTSPGPVCLDMDGKPGDKCGPRTFEMVVRLPNDASATQFSNCASVGGEQLSSDDPVACHQVSLKPAEPSPEPAKTTTPRECFAGMVLVGELCQCPPGTRFNGRRCASDTGDGGAYPILVPPPPRLECPASRPIGVYPNCCPVGTEYRSGACRPVGPGSGGADGTIPGRERPPPVVCPSSRPIGVYPNCCPRGTEYRFGACRPPRESGGSNGTAPNRQEPPPVAECPRSRPVGVYPNCCPRGTDFRSGACRARDSGIQIPPPIACPRSRPVGVFPNCCPTGTEFRNGMCRGGSGGADGTVPGREKPPQDVCPRSRPVGVFPNCCPKGTEFRNGMCRGGTGGADGTSPGSDAKCPPGYHKLRRPNKYGSYCEPDSAPVTKCPPNRPVGTPPNCCPPGTRYTQGQCYPDKCSPGWTGSPPNCRPPTQTGPTQTGPTPQQKCPTGQIGTPPKCHCPSGTTGPECKNVIVR